MSEISEELVKTPVADGFQYIRFFQKNGFPVIIFAMKTEDGVEFPAGDFAYVPDREKPSTWKLRLTSAPGGSPDSHIVGAAVAALGPGFRGQKVQIPADDLPAVKRKVRAAWRKAHPDAKEEDIPAAIKASEDVDPHRYSDLMEINGVEIFRSGKWNGDKYDDRDLDDMVENFDKVGFQVPVKLGHREVSGGEAYGWVKALRRMGDKLVADLKDVPAEIHAKIKSRAFDAVSAEIFWDLARNGRKFKRVLKAVALLGSEIPAVSGLKPLRDTFTEDELRAVHSYTLHTEDFTMPDDKQLDDVKAELKKTQEQLTKALGEVKTLKEKGGGDDLALQIKAMNERTSTLEKELSEAKERERKAVVTGKLDKLRLPAFKDHFRALYEFVSADPTKTVKFSTLNDKGEPVERDTPFISVLDDLVERINKGAEYLFKEHSTVGEWRRDDAPQDDPGIEIDRLVKKRIAADSKLDYATALEAVLADPENEQLKRQYVYGRQ